ncbi:MAG: urea ABC transporter ATP-binding subunit UrtE [Desulfovibrio sp.]|jgi:urea transport system ATP-binding protein|nr:urea ABC transporter ATP-binding subunit UrtE [Desulfovibrio sp.]
MLKVEGLNQSYGESHILRDVRLEARRGACACLMGRNGVGKTTLLQCIMGILPILSGRILLNGADISRLPPEKRAKAGLGYVPQGRQIFPLLTVEENMRLALLSSRSGNRKIPSCIYSFFPVLEEMLQRRGGDLSGGQQQQLAIARALVLEPDLLILDEPTEGIQPNIVQEIAAAIRRLMKEMSMTVLLVEQKVPFARSIADSYAIMERGHIAAAGPMTGLDAATVKALLSV